MGDQPMHLFALGQSEQLIAVQQLQIGWSKGNVMAKEFVEWQQTTIYMGILATEQQST